MIATEWIGWSATAVFTASYFCRDAVALRRVQAVGALLWAAYGAALASLPVIVANLLVLGAIGLAMRRERGASPWGTASEPVAAPAPLGRARPSHGQPLAAQSAPDMRCG